MKTLMFVLSLIAIPSVNVSASADWERPPPPGFGHGGPCGPGWGHQPPPSPPQRSQYVECSSSQHAFNGCAVQGYVQSAQVARQDSSASCKLGQCWSYERNSIWVDQGCRATFIVYFY